MILLKVAIDSTAMILQSTDLYPPTLGTNISPEYKDDNVTVTVNWIQDVYTVHYISVSPMVPLITVPSPRSILSRQLTIPYNTDYNLSIEATAPCRPNATAFIRLKYGETANCSYLYLGYNLVAGAMYAS